MQFHRDNHNVPRLYLNQWACSAERIWTYRILVSHPNVPLWKPSSPGGIAYHSHLYTQVVAGGETDEIERWLQKEFETPVTDAIQKAISDRRLTPKDWKRLIRFVAAQDVRTPAWFAEQAKRWGTTLPGLLEKTLSDSVRRLEDAARTGEKVKSSTARKETDSPFVVLIKPGSENEPPQIGAKIVVGRKLWLHAMKHVLGKTVNRLYQHKWTILSPPEGLNWFTTDNPVIRLNFNSISDYSFGGGWGSKGTEILLPLGPRHMMYTKIGEKPPPRGERMTSAQANLVRRLVALHAYRTIFSTERDSEISTLRPRIVDANLFRAEREQWTNWDSQQRAAEQELIEARALEVADTKSNREGG